MVVLVSASFLDRKNQVSSFLALRFESSTLVIKISELPL